MEDLKLSIKLLSDFNRSIKIRSSSFLTYQVLPVILNWHINIWKKDAECLIEKKRSSDVWPLYYQLKNILNSMFSSIFKRVLTENNPDYYYFFEKFTKHINFYKEEKIVISSGSLRYYVDDFLSNFYSIFLEESINSPNNFHLWSLFPKDWLITSSSLEDLKNIISRITCNNFLRWAQSKILQGKQKEFDSALDDASEHLFPEVDPIRWGAILLFTLSSYSHIENRVEDVINSPWMFGIAGRIRSFSGEMGDTSFEDKMQEEINLIEDAERDATFELIITLGKVIPIFSKTFSKDNLSKFISEAIRLENKYEINSIKDHRRKRLLEIFSGLLDFMTSEK